MANARCLLANFPTVPLLPIGCGVRHAFMKRYLSVQYEKTSAKKHSHMADGSSGVNRRHANIVFVVSVYLVY